MYSKGFTTGGQRQRRRRAEKNAGAVDEEMEQAEGRAEQVVVGNEDVDDGRGSRLG
jgi:hypothetical protein